MNEPNEREELERVSVLAGRTIAKMEALAQAAEKEARHCRRAWDKCATKLEATEEALRQAEAKAKEFETLADYWAKRAKDCRRAWAEQEPLKRARDEAVDRACRLERERDEARELERFRSKQATYWRERSRTQDGLPTYSGPTLERRALAAILRLAMMRNADVYVSGERMAEYARLAGELER